MRYTYQAFQVRHVSSPSYRRLAYV